MEHAESRLASESVLPDHPTPSVPGDAAVHDADLVEALRAHSLDALGSLYDRYGRLVFAVALRVVGDRSVAEEITQDVMLRCWNGIDRYQAKQGSFVTWLLAIAHHRAIDEIRSRRSQEQRQAVSVELIAPLPTHDLRLDAALLRRDIQAALQDLPPEQRRVVELIYWGSLSRHEAAEQIGVPLGTVHTRLRLAMDKLRTALGYLFRDEESQ